MTRPSPIVVRSYTRARLSVTTRKHPASVRRLLYRGRTCFGICYEIKCVAQVCIHQFVRRSWSPTSRRLRLHRTEEQIPLNRDIAYAMAKANTERMIYRIADEDGSFATMAILPLHVIGPLMCVNHDQGWSWQNWIKYMMMGKSYKKSRGGRMLWNNVDVRDTARAHGLAAESTHAKIGSRYIL